MSVIDIMERLEEARELFYREHKDREIEGISFKIRWRLKILNKSS